MEFIVGATDGVVFFRVAASSNKIGNFRVYPEIKAKGQLILTGPHRFIRHPMYMSLILLLTGPSLYLNHSINYIGLAGVIVAAFFKARKEERLLIARYPEYIKYRNRTSGFIPFVI